MDLIAIGQRIRQQREAFGYTRDRLAELLEITPRFCADIELGVKGMSIPTLMRVSRTLNLPTDHILFGNDGTADTSPIDLMLRSCDPKMIPHVETLIRIFLQAVSDT